jgi:acyl-CoA synthetase (AMP-forming)/AMP-acid ligase II
MESMEWSLPTAHDVIAAAAPDRDMLVWKSTRRTYAEVATRTRSFAAFLQHHGVGVRREREEIERW